MTVSISGCVLSALLFKLKNVSADGVSPIITFYLSRIIKYIHPLELRCTKYVETKIYINRASLTIALLLTGRLSVGRSSHPPGREHHRLSELWY